jgi:DNA-binding NtrC family response regulator
MAASILNGKKILAVDDEPDVLHVLEMEIMDACPDCVFETAATFETASKLLENGAYDIVILDIMGVRGFDLLDIAVKKNLKVAMLTAHAISLEALKRSYEMKARAFLPKDMLGEIVPFLEDILQLDYKTGWEKLAKKLPGFFTDNFETDWEKKTGTPWRVFKP